MGHDFPPALQPQLAAAIVEHIANAANGIGASVAA
jgi:hypothetical protein